MVIDAHVHLFPTRELGRQIVEDFKIRYDVPYHSFGTPDEYLADMRRASINYAVMVSFVRGLSLTDEERRKILSENSARLLRLV